MTTPLYQDKDWLEHKYLDECLSMSQIAELCGCSYPTARYWLRKFAIPARSWSEALELRWKQLGKRPYQSYDWLYQKYVIEELSAIKIADLCDCGSSTIYRWLEHLGITCRTQSEAHEIYYRDGDVRARISQTTTERWRNPEFYKRMCKILSGEGNPNWRGGTANNPYPWNWDKIRSAIRARDDYTCQLCGKAESECGRELATHHIDYDRDNNEFTNLIALCQVCHGKTNSNRKQWQRFFHFLISSPDCLSQLCHQLELPLNP